MRCYLYIADKLSVSTEIDSMQWSNASNLEPRKIRMGLDKAVEKESKIKKKSNQSLTLLSD